MERTYTSILTKFGPDDYSIWELSMPREKMHEVRQHAPVTEGDMRKVFEELQTAGDEALVSFVLPHGNALQLYTVDMGEDFVERNRHNGTSIRGSREEIMAEFRESLKSDGYHLRPNAAFWDVDVLATMQKIMEQNTDFYQTDFQYDVEKLREAMEDENGYRGFLWLTRKNGTWSFPERDVYINRTYANNTWNYYGGSKSEKVKAFYVELKRMDNDKNIIGNIAEIDYQKHLDYLCTHSFDPVAVEIAFKHPHSVRSFSYQEYDQNWQSIRQRYGTADHVQFQVSDSHQLAHAAITAHNLFWDATEPTDIDSYVKRLEHDQLHDYGYTEGDMHRIGPLDAEKALRHHLCCCALQADGTKEVISDRDAFQKHLGNSGLFGMTAAEKQILQYFKQDCTPLFSSEEMRTICALALQAGMNNDPAHVAVLDSIIHKAECCLPQAEAINAHKQEQTLEREE